MEEVKSITNKLKEKQPSKLEAEQEKQGSIHVNNDMIDEISTIVNT